MRIVTAGSRHYAYAKTISYTVASAVSFKYDFNVYDLGGLGIGEKVIDRRCESEIRQPKFSLKPELTLRQARLSTGTVAWIDGDAALIRPIDELDADDSWDIGLTVRPKPRVKKTHCINAGVFFVKCNPAAYRLMEHWIDSIIPPPEDLTKKHAGFCDQEVLEEKILLPSLGTEPWNLMGKVVDVHGTRVKFLECRRYNNFWVWDEKRPPDPDTAVLHFKNHQMKKLESYVNTYFR